MNTKFINILLFFASILIGGCTSKNDDSITMGVLNGPTAVSAIQLIDQSPAIDEKKIDVILKSEPQQIQAMMMKSELDFAVLPTVMAVNLYNKGIKYRMLACPVWGTLYIMTNTQSGEADELTNQTVSVFGESSTADVLLQRLIRKNGIKNVHIDYQLTSNNEVARALVMKKIKFGVVSEPLVSKLLSENPNIRIFSKLSCQEMLDKTHRNIFVQTAFLVSDEFIRNHPHLINHVCETYSSSCNFTNSNPDKTAELMVKHHLSPTLHIAKESIPLCNIHYVGAFALQSEIRSYLQIFNTFNPKSIGNTLPDQHFIYTPIADKE